MTVAWPCSAQSSNSPAAAAVGATPMARNISAQMRISWIRNPRGHLCAIFVTVVCVIAGFPSIPGYNAGSLFLGPRDAVKDHLARFGGIAPAQDLDPFARLQI